MDLEGDNAPLVVVVADHQKWISRLEKGSLKAY